MTESGPAGRPTRRDLLAAAGSAALASTSGCLRRLRSILNRESSDQVSVRIKTVPADNDEVAVRIARHLAGHLEEVGVQARVVPMAEDELLRDVLINHDFDMYVATHSGVEDPDVLRPFTHSKFAGEPGWQNPFGFTDLGVDDLLESQRRLGGQSRTEAVEGLQHELARQQPFTVVAIPDDIWAVRGDRFVGWDSYGLGTPLTYLALRRDGDSPTEDEQTPDDGPLPTGTLEVTITDDRLTKNSNPIAVEFRSRGTFMGLLYDPLVRRYEVRTDPWLAEELTWSSERGNRRVVAKLRENATWHDGEPVTAQDVAFTYRFLVDTSLGGLESPVPAPRFRARTSLFETAEVLDDRRVALTFDASREVAERSLTVPILPEEEWRPRSEETEIAGLEFAEGTTEALVWDNPEPIGSGPLRFDERIPEELLALERFDDHFLNDGESEPARRFGPVPYNELDVRVAPSSTAAVELVSSDRADATATPVNPADVPRIGRDGNLQLVVRQSESFYHVGFNARRPPASNTRFRRTVARLVDKAHIVESALDGYASPAASPLAGSRWLSSQLRWDRADPEVPFFGIDGQLDVEAAKQAFRDAGFRYADGELVAR